MSLPQRAYNLVQETHHEAANTCRSTYIIIAMKNFQKVTTRFVWRAISDRVVREGLSWVASEQK